ncbi:MAG: hypothetical protein WA151_14610 [Desulfatirhabdiaceae bacterium]
MMKIYRIVSQLHTLIMLAILAALPSVAYGDMASDETARVCLIGLGDSLTHGTMDGTNNILNTKNAYLQKIAESLSSVLPLHFSQPFYGFHEQRLRPLMIPTNLGIDGSDVFSLEGIEYYKRVGAEESYGTDAYLCNSQNPRQFQDDYDKVMYPLNLVSGKPLSQLDASLTLLSSHAIENSMAMALVFVWIGNNDSSLAALGTGGANPSFIPLPLDAISKEISPALRTFLDTGRSQGLISFEPYTPEAINRNLTEVNDFANQFNHALFRLNSENGMPKNQTAIFVLTLPYYSAVGYLFDSDDIEFYLQQINPEYRVPQTFNRVVEAGQIITDALKGDRVSLFTFASMYALMISGYSIDQVNAILEKDGIQQDGLVMSEAEQQTIMSRIDSFNQAIQSAADQYDNVFLIDVGRYLNAALSGEVAVEIAGETISRKWSRGNAFSLDGVHPAYTGQALIGNYILERINGLYDIQAPLFNLEEILASDPYVDRDGDGWVPGPCYPNSGLTELLFMFTDPNDQDPSVKGVLPSNFWERMSRILLKELIGQPSLASLGQIPAH